MEKAQHKQYKSSVKRYLKLILENPTAKDVFLNVFSAEAVRKIETAAPQVTQRR